MSEQAVRDQATGHVERSGLAVAPVFAEFIEAEALPGTGIEPDRFWAGLSDLLHGFGPRNAALLATRDDLQARLDAWHVENRDKPHDTDAYRAFLIEIGYLLPGRAATSSSRPARSTRRFPRCRAHSSSCR